MEVTWRSQTLPTSERFNHRQGWCPRQDSNLRTRLRRPVLYPLSYEGKKSTRPLPAGGTMEHPDCAACTTPITSRPTCLTRMGIESKPCATPLNCRRRPEEAARPRCRTSRPIPPKRPLSSLPGDGSLEARGALYRRVEPRSVIAGSRYRCSCSAPEPGYNGGVGWGAWAEGAGPDGRR